MTIRTIVCCTDFSENAHRAVAQAVDMAARFNAKLYLLHVLPPLINPVLLDSGWIPPEMPRDAIILKIEEQMQARYGAQMPHEVDYELVVRDGHVSSEILEFVRAQSVDLAIMGAYGLSGMGLVLFGSVAKRVAQKAACSVLIVREAGP
ncbi:MAG: universal stress protein [Desulfobacterales bacterium]|nr:universal stress protein [Desulfobacterales bacterium]MDJ0888173.1 universal stress protein [Desulfobacterales bacterium]